MPRVPLLSRPGPGRPARDPGGRLFYGWIIAGVIAVTWAISIGPRQSFSIFLLPFIEDFGASRSSVAGLFSVHMASYAVGGWGLGILLDRLGPKKVIVASTAAWAATMAACSGLGSLWQLYLVYGVAGGIATSGLAYVPNNALLSHWFIRYRGRATGLSQAGVPLGTALFGPLAQLGIGLWGWRSTHVAFGLLVAAIALPLVVLFLRDDPKELGLLADGVPAPPDAAPADPVSGPAASVARGLPPGYWAIFAANLLRGTGMYALMVHQVAYMVDVGFTKIAAASYFSANFVLAVAGGLAAGLISDRVGRLRTYAGMALLYVMAYASLLLVRGPDQLLLLVLFVLSSGLAAGGVSPVFAAFLTDRLQGPRLGSLLGLQNIGFGIGATLGPYLAGLLFDAQRSYVLAFVLAAAGMVASSVLSFRADRVRHAG
ncbi:MAG: MFS transporter [Candidatus Methylomirabilales bacterium]